MEIENKSQTNSRLEQLVEIEKLQEYANDLGVDAECLRMYQAFYEQHKTTHGSYKQYIRTDEYDQKMQERDNWIYDRMKETIDCKYQMNRENQE